MTKTLILLALAISLAPSRRHARKSAEPDPTIRPLPVHPRDFLIRHRRLPRKRGHDDGGLLQLVLAHALGVVGVGVARALVIPAQEPWEKRSNRRRGMHRELTIALSRSASLL